MKTKLLFAAAMLFAVVSTNAQIKKYKKYDWGWSYLVEMPETGLKCEFPERPVVTTLAYGYMTSASFNDELYVAAKMENHDPRNLVGRTEEFARQLQKLHGLKLSNLKWDAIRSENGHLVASANTVGPWAKYHIDAIATEDVLTIFLYTHHDGLSVPGYFFAKSYSVYDMKEGHLDHQASSTTVNRAKVLEQNKNRTVVRLDNSTIKCEWPDVPSMKKERHEASYTLSKEGSTYRTRIIELEPQLSYTFFNTYVNGEHQKRCTDSPHELLEDEMDVAMEFNHENEAYFRKLKYRSATGEKHIFYVAAENKIIVQELEVNGAINSAAARFLHTFEQSVRNQYDTRVLVAD